MTRSLWLYLGALIVAIIAVNIVVRRVLSAERRDRAGRQRRP
jgi:uncharacterized membrane protein